MEPTCAHPALSPIELSEYPSSHHLSFLYVVLLLPLSALQSLYDSGHQLKQAAGNFLNVV